MVNKINADSVVLIKSNKSDDDEFGKVGGISKLEKAIAAAGAEQVSATQKKVTHVLMSGLFESDTFSKGPNKGERVPPQPTRTPAPARPPAPSAPTPPTTTTDPPLHLSRSAKCTDWLDKAKARCADDCEFVSEGDIHKVLHLNK